MITITLTVRQNSAPPTGFLPGSKTVFVNLETTSVQVALKALEQAVSEMGELRHEYPPIIEWKFR